MLCAAIIAGFVSGISVILAWFFGRFLDLPPCELCIYARWLTAAFSVACFAWAWSLNRLPNRRSWVFLGVLVIGFMSVVLSIVHSLIERGIVHVHMGCTHSQLTPDQVVSAQGFKKLIEDKASARCDKISWSFLGLSMANYNGLLTLMLLGALAYARKKELSKN